MKGLERFLGNAMTLIGIAFLFAGGMKLANPAGAVATFASWGVNSPGWIPVAAWIEVGLGAGLLNWPTKRIAAAGLAMWLAGWAVQQATAGAITAAVASAGFMLPAAAFAAVTRWPWRPVDGWIIPPLENRPDTPARAAHRLLRLVGLSFLIRWCIGGIAFWISLLILGWLHARRAGASRTETPDTVLLYLLVLGLGVSGLWGFVGHTFMAEAVGESVGWEPSPFQRELAFYHLGIGMAGLACWWIRDHFWLAVAVIASVFLVGAGCVHLGDFITTGNRAPNNWGFGVLFGNALLPAALLWLTVVRARSHRVDDRSARNRN